jgi:hypothetical protein
MHHLPERFGGGAPTACRHPVSGSLSLPSSGCFSPFPHGTCALSVTEEYLGLEGGPPMFRQDFTCPALLEDASDLLPVRGHHPLWPAVPGGSGSVECATGLVRFRSPLLAESRLMSFPPATEMFQFAGFASAAYEFSDGRPRRAGFPHSEIRGSKPARGSPRLIAACYVLHRLSVPRHPPNALLRLSCPQPMPRGNPRKRHGFERYLATRRSSKPMAPAPKAGRRSRTTSRPKNLFTCQRTRPAAFRPG